MLAWSNVCHSVTTLFILEKILHAHVCCFRYQRLLYFWGRKIFHHVCTWYFLYRSICSNLSCSLPGPSLKGLKCAWEFRCLYGTLVGVALYIVELCVVVLKVLACSVCLFACFGPPYCFQQPLYHFTSPLFLCVFCPCCLMILVNPSWPLVRPCGEISCQVPFIFNYVICFLYWSLGDPYTFWIILLPEPTGVNDAC